MLKLYYVFTLFIICTSSHSHKCIHKNLRNKNYIQVEPKQKNKNRFLQQQFQWEPFRLTFDYSALYGLPQSHQNFRNFMIQQGKIAQKFFYENLYVKRTIGNNKFPNRFNNCGQVQVPQKDKEIGIQNSDMHIYFTYEDNRDQNYFAWASACLIQETDLRPVFGQINWNSYYVSQLDLSRNDISEFFTEVTLHEITHTLGFSSQLYQYWIYPQSSKHYFQTDYHPVETFKINGKEIQFITSPKVKKLAAEYFNCSTIQGMPLENFGTSGTQGVHWEKSILENEFMIGEIQTHDAIYSNFTFALLEDSGWYKPTYKYIDHADWGKNQGCQFIENCDSKIHKEFEKKPEKYSCNFYHNAIQNNNLQSQLADMCNLPQVTRTCIGQGHNNFDQTGEQFGENSRCFKSDLFQDNIHPFSSYILNNQYGNTRCLHYKCNQRQEISVLVGGEYYKINSKTNKVDIKPQGKNQMFTGTVYGPSDWKSFCNTYPQPCKNYCSKNGYCLAHKCHCLNGWEGEDCSIKIK